MAAKKEEGYYVLIEEGAMGDRYRYELFQSLKEIVGCITARRSSYFAGEFGVFRVMNGKTATLLPLDLQAYEALDMLQKQVNGAPKFEPLSPESSKGICRSCLRLANEVDRRCKYDGCHGYVEEVCWRWRVYATADANRWLTLT